MFREALFAWCVGLCLMMSVLYCASGGSTVDVSVDDPIVGGGDVVCNPDDPEEDCPEE